jgi:hypothetical protein
MLLLATRLIPLDNSLWNDELHSAISYINPGPSGIWGGYTPNDHMLFELLSWATVHLAGNHADPTYRVWGVLPAVAAAVILTAWAWRRLGPWVAAIFGVLFTTSPLAMSLSVQARGYGLGLLASALTLIGAEEVAQQRSRWGIGVFAAGGLLGIWTLPTFVLPFLALAGTMCLRKQIRRQVVLVVLAVGAATLLFYAPVLAPLSSSASALRGSSLPWHGVITGPLVDLMSPSVQLLAPSVSLTGAEIVSACVLMVGITALLLQVERFLALLLIVAAPFTYLVFELTGTATADRFMSFLLPALLLVAAVALVAAGRLLASRGRLLAIVVVALGVGLSMFALRRGEHQFVASTTIPIEDWHGAAVLAEREPTIITNSRYSNSLSYYVRRPVLRILDGPLLEHTICSHAGAFAYVAHDRAPSPQVSTDCLAQRGATSIPMQQLRGELTVWLVPARLRRAQVDGRSAYVPRSTAARATRHSGVRSASFSSST